jgi:hypothetical protein
VSSCFAQDCGYRGQEVFILAILQLLVLLFVAAKRDHALRSLAQDSQYFYRSDFSRGLLDVGNFAETHAFLADNEFFVVVFALAL